MSVLFQDTNPTAIHAEKPTIDLSHAVCTVQNRVAVTVTLCDCQNQLKSYLMEHKQFECLSMCKLVGALVDASAKLHLVNSCVLNHRDMCSSCSPGRRRVFATVC